MTLPAGRYNSFVQRFAYAIIVALLTFGASGLSALVISEPCTASEQPRGQDGSCPPTCVTCGCCSQAAEPVNHAAAGSLDSPVADISPLAPPLLKTHSRDILHVPKPHLA
jgi:hypothetical protein